MTGASPLTTALDAFRAGRPAVLVDGDQDPEEVAALSFMALAAEVVTPESINHLLRLSGGLVYVCLSEERAHALGLRPVKLRNPRSWQTRVFDSFEAAACCDGGISARDRALTVQLVADPAAGPSDVRQPGGVGALVAAAGGTLEASGYTEAALDLARLAGFSAAVISEVLDADGRLVSAGALQRLASEHGIPVVSVRDVVRYRTRHEPVVRVVARTWLPTSAGTFEAVGLSSPLHAAPYLALVASWDSAPVPVVSVHRSCVGAAIGSRACNCQARLERAMETVSRQGGVIVHLPRPEAHDVRGHDAEGVSVTDAELTAMVLRALGVGRARVLDDDELRRGLGEHGIEVIELDAPARDQRPRSTKVP